MTTMTPPYNDYGSWLRSRLPFKVQKISVDAGFSCPNRDGRLSRGGCTFCDNRTFNPSYCSTGKSIAAQIAEGKRFFARKYPDMKYIAYFQAYSNTYADLDTLRRRYEEALEQEDVVGLVIGTRPDCVDESKLDYLAGLARECLVIVEYGVESVDDNTLRRINRGHDFACSQRAMKETRDRGIITCGHFILGLPGETAQDNLRQASVVGNMDMDIIKLHQLQIIRGTRMAEEYALSPFALYEPDEYMRLCADYIERLRPDIVIERLVSQSSADLLVAPRWGLKNYEFTQRLNNYMSQNAMRQGRLWHANNV